MVKLNLLCATICCAIVLALTLGVGMPSHGKALGVVSGPGAGGETQIASGPGAGGETQIASGPGAGGETQIA